MITTPRRLLALEPDPVEPLTPRTPRQSKLLSWSWATSAAVLVLFAGLPDGWLNVILLGLAAVGWCLARRRVGLPWPVLILGGLFLLWLGLASTPLPHLGGAQWREPLQQLGLETAGWSVQPVWSTGRWLYAFTMVILLGWMWGMRLGRRSRKNILQAWIALLTGLAFVAALATMQGVINPWAPNLQVFSFTPNHNQWALVLAQGVVLAVGCFLKSEHVPARLLLGTALAVMAIALALSESQAAQFLALVGAGYLVGMQILRAIRPSLQRWWAVACIVVVPLAFAIAIWRAAPVTQMAPHEVSAGVRKAIYADTLQLVADQPWQGVGLGNFADVFPQYRDASLSVVNARHPENDWLWLAAEAGVPAALLMLALVLALAVWLWRLRAYQDSFHRTAAVAAWLLLGHSLIDVSGHRLVTVAISGLLFMLALPATEKPEIPPRLSLRSLLSGLACAGLTIGWAALVGLSPMGVFRQPTLERAQSVEAAQTAVNRIPLDWRTHFELARQSVAARDFAEAENQFRIARRLAPFYTVIPLREAQVWLPFAPQKAVAAWRLALSSGQGLSRDWLFGEIWGAAQAQPAVRPQLVALSQLHPAYRLRALELMDDATFTATLPAELAGANWPQWAEDRQQALLLRYLKLGQATGVEGALARSPALERRCSWMQAWALANAGATREASALLQATLAAPVVPYGDKLPLNLLELRLRRDAQDYASAQALCQRYAAEGRYQEVREVLQLVSWEGQVPPALHYWQAQTTEVLEGATAAWQRWPAYFMAAQRWGQPIPVAGGDPESPPPVAAPAPDRPADRAQ
ncbi:MAG: O-antigen ligase family protein [Verrucomicrobiota bacterium JB022]|nr:O-antigen ligase family protein [Verrucomicrobiota bacterium JB022]